MPSFRPRACTASASARMSGNFSLGTIWPSGPRLPDHASSMTMYWKPRAASPLRSSHSAACSTFSASTAGPQTFHEFQPIGGVSASASLPPTIRNSLRAAPPGPAHGQLHRAFAGLLDLAGDDAGGRIDSESRGQTPGRESQRRRAGSRNAKEERSSGRCARDARAVNGRPGRCRRRSDARQLFRRGDIRGRPLAIRLQQLDHRPGPRNLVVVAGVAAVVDEQREDAGAPQIRGQQLGRIARAHEAAGSDSHVVGPDLEDDGAHVAADLVIDSDRRREASGVALEVDDELADGARADAVRIFDSAQANRLVANRAADARRAAPLREALEADLLDPHRAGRRRRVPGRSRAQAQRRRAERAHSPMEESRVACVTHVPLI